MRTAVVMRDGRTLRVDLWYPRCEGPDSIDKIVISLMDVRGADDLHIGYDFDRDGWTISRCDVDDAVTEVAFIPAQAGVCPSNPS